MAKKTLKNPPKAPPKFKETAASTWESMQVFPDALTSAGAELTDKVLAKFKKIGIANLRYLCAEAGILYQPKAGSTVLAKHVLAAAPGRTLVCLLDFVKRREQSILEQYEAEFTASERSQHES